MQNKLNILVVEDSMTQAVALQDVLERQGWSVSLASNADSAMVSLAERLPDLVITDYLLPGMRGDELCRRLRLKLETRRVPIVMLTGEGQGEVAGIDSGADLYVAKPFDADLLVARLRPLLEKSPGEPTAADELVQTADFRNSRILAIDDSLTYLEYLRVLLTEEGYVVDAVNSGEAGLVKLREFQYDCVLVDLVMPVLSGIEVCQRVLSEQSTVEDPVVMLMLTAHETKEEVTRGLAAGADDFVSKNSDVAVLKARIRALLRRKFLQTENKRIIEKLKNRELEAVRARAEQEISRTRAQMFEQLEKTATDLKVSNEELDKARQIAVHASASKSEFLANMSHEIRTPINGVIGMTNLLLDLDLNPAQRDYVDTIKRSADALLVIVNDILDFSKVEAGKLELEHIGFDLRQNMDDILRTFRQTNRKTEVQLVADFAADLPRVVSGDPGRLRQILTNLVNNALKFTERGSVTLKILAQDGGGERPLFHFAVADTGIGISAYRRDRLFQAFSQVDSSTSRRYGGTGLGLAISKRLVNLMGGQIGVDSVEGQGSTFWFDIPMEVGGEIQRTTSLTETLHESIARIKGRHVLIAEDNLINQKVALLMMDKLGMKAHAVGNGREAIEALKRQTFDIVLMDCHMPELDGYEATRAIREGNEVFRQIPVIAMTANALAGEREKCLVAGMNDYVAKPVHIDVLAGKLAHFLQQDRGRVLELAPEPDVTTVVHLDVDQLERTISLDDGGAESWIQMFEADATDRLARIREALVANDFKIQHINAHALKSSCGYLGALGMQRICEDLERTQGPAAGPLVDELAAEFARVQEALADFRQRRVA